LSPEGINPLSFKRLRAGTDGIDVQSCADSFIEKPVKRKSTFDGDSIIKDQSEVQERRIARQKTQNKID
jgi:hypothetical protein